MVLLNCGKPGDFVAKTLTFNQFVDEVAATVKKATKMDVSRKEARTWTELVFESVKTNISKGVKVPGFGKFQVRQLKARTGRNPATGEAIKIPARSKVAFSAAKELKEKYNKKGK